MFPPLKMEIISQPTKPVRLLLPLINQILEVLKPPHASIQQHQENKTSKPQSYTTNTFETKNMNKKYQ